MTGYLTLYENGPLLVVLKPPGLLTQAPPGIDSLELRIKEALRRQSGGEAKVYLGVPHRLDRPASGVMVFARSRRATRRLAEQFEARTVEKRYWAIVAGTVEPPQGTWEDHVRKVPGEPRGQVVAADQPEGRPAVLHYRTVARGPWGTWLAIELETGRTHQVRIQAASRGHPLLGDSQYGSRQPFGPQFDDPRLRAIALHARRLTIDDPKTREPVAITAPPPQPWIDLLGADLIDHVGNGTIA